MSEFTLALPAVDAVDVALVGGKAANLARLMHLDGPSVPDGFCVTTEAFRMASRNWAGFDALIDDLDQADPHDRVTIETKSSAIRRLIESASVPPSIAAEVSDAMAALGDPATAVRSSATAEDRPNASFAGQQDSYLNVIGIEAVLDAVVRCWASLFTDRAVAYRRERGIDSRGVQMAVIVQRLVRASAAGVMFTADPLSGNRRVVTVEAVRGLADELVAGTAPADITVVRDGVIEKRNVSIKPFTTEPLDAGGTARRSVDEDAVQRPALDDDQVLELARLGQRIATDIGYPQDIEWCIDEVGIHIVQSRPITSLFPVPMTTDGRGHVFVSVGHQQMMTDPIRPLGLSIWQMTAARPMHHAGGRLFVDVADALAAPASRHAILDALGASDPRIRDALETVISERDVVSPEPENAGPVGPVPPAAAGASADAPDPSVVKRLIASNEQAVARSAEHLGGAGGAEVFDGIVADIADLRAQLFDPDNLAAIWAAVGSARWLNENLGAWLGETNPADELAHSAPDNITAEMGLDLLDVADAVRAHPEVVDYLRTHPGSDVLDGLSALAGGAEVRAAFDTYLDRYGMRCIGEIDITRPRWVERPNDLIPMVLANVDNFVAGEATRRFDRGTESAARARQDILSRVGNLADGAQKVAETEAMIDRLRAFTGYREYPKYSMMQRYLLYKEAMLRAAGGLVQSGAIDSIEDIYFLFFDELADAVRNGTADRSLIAQRRAEYRTFESLRAPRVLTSDGEALDGAYRSRNVPAGALVGVAVSVGDVEGRARVVHDVAEADLEPGDILVTTCTDPSWSPLFVAISGLVTEVGGLMTHGAVIAREYGLTAVVGVDGATTVIRDGQRIRVNGTDGYVEILDDA